MTDRKFYLFIYHVKYLEYRNNNIPIIKFRSIQSDISNEIEQTLINQTKKQTDVLFAKHLKLRIEQNLFISR